MRCEVECTTWVNCFQTLLKEDKPEYLVVELGIMLPQYLEELVKGFTIENIGRNLMKINIFSGSECNPGSNIGKGQ
jgi:hypothetical protein